MRGEKGVINKQGEEFGQAGVLCSFFEIFSPDCVALHLLFESF